MKFVVCLRALTYAAALTAGAGGVQSALAQNAPGSGTGIERLAYLTGDWDIEFESRNAPEKPFTRLSTTSSIAPMLDGAFLQEQLTLPAPSGRSIRLVGIWGYDRFRSLYRFAWLDDMYRLFDVHEGNWSGDVLVVDNTRTRTTMQFDGQEYYSRMLWGPLHEDGFDVESQVSVDGGITWVTMQRGRYTRRP